MAQGSRLMAAQGQEPSYAMSQHEP